MSRPGVLIPPIPPKIAIVGEAWGEEEAKLKQPFVGTSGKELRAMVSEAGWNFHEALVTNVFCQRPGISSNDLKYLCGPTRPTDKPYSIPLCQRPSLWLLPEHHHHIQSLWSELSSVNLVVALGNTATWALLGVEPKISSMRGTFWKSPYIKAKILPTYHPAAVMRQWSLRTIVVTDLIKAKGFCNSTKITRPSRLVHIDPTLEDLKEWEQRIYSEAIESYKSFGLPEPIISIDLECESGSKKDKEKYITCISFAPRPDRSYVVPFVKDGWKNYWESFDAEFEAWEFVRRICESSFAKLFQKHLFDTYVLRRLMRISVRGRLYDTMHLHHALFPEIQKDLGFLGSIYTEEEAWKLERPKGKKGQEKRDD